MAQSTTGIVRDFTRELWHHDQMGAWYLGLTNDPSILSGQYGLREDDPCIVREAKSVKDASEVVAFFISRLHNAGNPTPTGDDQVFVYAYLMEPHADP